MWINTISWVGRTGVASHAICLRPTSITFCTLSRTMKRNLRPAINLNGNFCSLSTRTTPALHINITDTRKIVYHARRGDRERIQSSLLDAAAADTTLVYWKSFNILLSPRDDSACVLCCFAYFTFLFRLFFFRGIVKIDWTTRVKRRERTTTLWAWFIACARWLASIAKQSLPARQCNQADTCACVDAKRAFKNR